MPKTHPSQLVDPGQDPSLGRKYIPGYLDPTPPRPATDYKLNVVKDRIDTRDYIYRAPTSGIKASVDLRSLCTPVEDQGPLGSCTGHAVSSAMEILLKRQRREMELSRLFIYYHARLLINTVNWDSGAYLRDAVKSVNKWGASNEKLWQYNIREYKTRPSTIAYEDARSRRATEYRRCAGAGDIRAALSEGHPVVIGFLVYSSFMSADTVRRGTMIYPNVRRETMLGGHAVCLVGYDNGRQTFIAKNSWGSNWGDRGYFYMPYKVLEDPRMSMDFWAIVGVV